MDELLHTQIIQSCEKEGEDNFEKEICKLQEENPKKSNNVNVKRCKFQCHKCGRFFATNSGFHKHIITKRIPCDKIIDQKVWITKHLYILSQKYKELKNIALCNLEDDILKRRILLGVHTKATIMLKAVEENKDIISDSEDIIYSIKVMIQNCSTGEYENMDLIKDLN